MRSKDLHVFLENVFLVSMFLSMILNIVLIFYIYFDLLELKFLETNSKIYFISTLLYAGARQVRRRVYGETDTRPNELVVGFWLLFALVSGVVISFFRQDKFNLLQEIVFITSVVAGILAGGEGIKYLLNFLKK